MSTVIPDRFAGRTIIVTGAGSGIGRATATRLVAEGAYVVGADLSEERLAAVAEDLGSPGFRYVVGSITDQQIVDRIVAEAGPELWGLVNNAGIMDDFLSVAEIDDATWQRVFDVNLTAMMRMSRAAIPVMLTRGAGAIVNISSEAGIRAGAAGVAYTASKHAVIGLTKSTSLFYARKGIRCNSVAPGGVATNIQAKMESPGFAEVIAPLLGAMMPPTATADDLAAAITFLLSDDAANVTGTVLMCDGGWSVI
ncbi:SDR family NAD(P)-dependent oxidoreductase [Raineyella sp. LH-20]|uniref:SDR family NAD(P)-dependent oxidoreductase n=1 Tax=Raineyella sp. LH-20 TaxID=3081204 RepID=UPI0029529DF3|nr:SDR family NAD(P)-dependent oxidoreductase [Raineyella sp. LH-20]WOP17522.1 SDR family NAD(P)-dependent oxidoreductase [Raineyella sp. LH-20]